MKWYPVKECLIMYQALQTENLSEYYHLRPGLYQLLKESKIISEKIFSRSCKYQLEIQGSKNSLQSRNAILIA